MPEMQPLKPCARCEQELPESFFDHNNSMFCKRCNQEVTDILRQKYNVIEAALFRAQLRRSSKQIKKKLATGETKRVAAAAGD